MPVVKLGRHTAFALRWLLLDQRREGSIPSPGTKRTSQFWYRSSVGPPYVLRLACLRL